MQLSGAPQRRSRPTNWPGGASRLEERQHEQPKVPSNNTKQRRTKKPPQKCNRRMMSSPGQFKSTSIASRAQFKFQRGHRSSNIIFAVTAAAATKTANRHRSLNLFEKRKKQNVVLIAPALLVEANRRLVTRSGHRAAGHCRFF